MEIENFKLAEAGLVFQQRATIDIQGRYITVYNIHLTYPRLERSGHCSFLHIPLFIYNDTVRQEEIGNLLFLLQTKQTTTLAAGDFNMTSRSGDYKKLTSHFTDGYQAVGTGRKYSWPACRNPALPLPVSIPIVRIDYLFHCAAFRSTSARFLKKTGSDHLPLLVSLMLYNL